MRQWLCHCNAPTNVHTAAEAICAACGYTRPPELDPLPDEARARYLGLAEWLDAELAKRPTLLQSMVGAALTQVVAQAKRDPDGSYRQIAPIVPALSAIVAWTEHGEPAPDGAFAILGPEG